jgi:hypothetical protein
MLLTLIAIFLFVSFEQALDSQRNNKDIFRNDSREMQRKFYGAIKQTFT